MYASYNMLYADSCGQTPFTAETDSTRFVCASLPDQKQVRKSIYSDQMFPLDVPCVHGECETSCNYDFVVKQKKVKQPQKINIQSTRTPIKESFELQRSSSTSASCNINIPTSSKLADQDYNRLLPVMDPIFNLREICKQCILLEDHLCHNEKRCFDCCVKHFLTIEALAEEAITLDSSQKHTAKIQSLPSHIRRLQHQWHQDPDNNSQTVSHELRKIRKDFQLDTFDIVFQSTPSCQDGVCYMNQSVPTTLKRK